MKIKYEVIEKAENELDSVLTKTGHSDKFTMRNVQDNIEALRKLKIELEGKLAIDKATMDNIERNHPVVKGFDEAQLLAIYMYGNAKKNLAPYQAKLDEVEKALAEVPQELAEITKQTGLILIERKKPDENK